MYELSTITDALGRTIKTTDRLSNDDADDVTMRYLYDIQGNLKLVTDALNRVAFSYVYDLKPKAGEEDSGANVLWMEHIDSGEKTAVFDAAFKNIELNDAKEAQVLNAYDGLQRPVKMWAKDIASEAITLRQYLFYGDSAGLSTPEDTNHLGQLYRHMDEAGRIIFNAYDFKGNLLQKQRSVVADSEIMAMFTGPPAGWDVPTFRVDWDNPPTLEGTYVTDMLYDALNRITQLVYPKDVDDERKVLLPSYNKAGALESVELDSDKYVTHFAYNAKGQRILIAYANTVMTRYAYDYQTFRLMRQRSETYTQTGYSFESAGSVKQDTAYVYDLHGNIIETTDKTTGCGIGGIDTLSREFDYDALYRLLQATGRENTPTITSIWDDSYRSTDNSTTSFYTQNYQYDKMGNIQQLQHVGYSSFTRNFTYFSNTNKLQNIQVGTPNFPFTYDANGNQLTEATRRRFQWDYADRLRSYKMQSGTSEPTQHAHYLYDASGNRVKKLVRVQGGSYTSTVYIDGIFEYKTNGTDTQNTLHVMDDQSRIATVRLGDDFGDTTPAVKYNLEDHLGSSTLQLEESGANINREEYYPFGETSFGSYAKKRYKYCGKERDNESGLYYYGARYYNAWTGRFVSCDPMFEERSWLTPYNYVQNNPINSTDPTGALDDGVSEGKNEGGDSSDSNTSTSSSFWDNYQLGDFSNGNVTFQEYLNSSDAQTIETPSGTKPLFQASRAERAAHNLLQEYRKNYPDHNVTFLPPTDWLDEHSSEYISIGVSQVFDGQIMNGYWTSIKKSDYPEMSTGESMIPIWGSGKQAFTDFSDGSYIFGGLNAAMAVSDAFLVKSLATGALKGGISALTKNTKHWSGWRSYYGSTGYAKPGQHLHHWALKRNGQKSGVDFAWKLKNQMWNLMPMQSAARHSAVHGWGGKNAYGPVGKFWYGTPTWFKAGSFSIGGRIGNTLRD